jgi:hypothetical protein
MSSNEPLDLPLEQGFSGFLRFFKQQLQEFFVQNDPILAHALKGSPVCYADQVFGLRDAP